MFNQIFSFMSRQTSVVELFSVHRSVRRWVCWANRLFGVAVTASDAHFLIAISSCSHFCFFLSVPLFLSMSSLFAVFVFLCHLSFLFFSFFLPSLVSFVYLCLFLFNFFSFFWFFFIFVLLFFLFAFFSFLFFNIYSYIFLFFLSLVVFSHYSFLFFSFIVLLAFKSKEEWYTRQTVDDDKHHVQRCLRMC